MKAVFLFMVLSILCFSCKNKKEEFTEKIAGSGEMYWDCYGKLEKGKRYILKQPNTCLKFDVNGNYRHYTYHTRMTMYDSEEMSDIVYENKWKYVDENYIELDGRKIQITFLSKDSLACKFEGDDEGVFFFVPRKQKARIVSIYSVL